MVISWCYHKVNALLPISSSFYYFFLDGLILGNLAVNRKLAGVFLNQFLTVKDWDFYKKRNQFLRNRKLKHNSLANRKIYQYLQDRFDLAKQKNSTQSSQYSIANM
jgi:hypothetical protein